MASIKLQAAVTGGAISGYEVERKSLCVLGTKVCARHNELVHMRELLSTRKGGGVSTKIDASTKPDTPEEIVAATMRELGVADEAAIWQHPRMIAIVGTAPAAKIIREAFKPEGPAGSVALLNNFNIDTTLKLWEKHGEEMFGKKFTAIPFQMIDFAEVGSELADVELVYKLHKAGRDAFGVVLNTDVSSGRGKHWFCIYGDLAHAGTEDDPMVIEYFNSSGFPPMIQVAAWIEKVIMTMATGHKLVVVRHDSVPQQLQKSHTECGVWSLMYIRSRLDGNPPDWFYSERTTDADITRMRALFFR